MLGRSSRKAGLIAGGMLCGVLWGQDQGKRPLPPVTAGGLTIEEVLDQLQGNLSLYRSSVPDLFCNEHVVSAMESRRVRTETVTDSTFRLRRLHREDGLVEFEESRVLRAVDGRVPVVDSEKLSGPAVLSGVFSDGLEVVSREVRGCYVYTMHPVRPGHPKDRIVVDFKNLPRAERAVGCPPFEETRGRATIDPVTMHVVRLEKTTPDPTFGVERAATWTWTVDYGPVQMAGKMLWMPLTIWSVSRTDDGSYKWIFDGRYSNYHLFHAKSRIVPVEP
ncbi:hypothetical protein BH10ACI4_BH10ACI4_15140 [soil metagenome]